MAKLSLKNNEDGTFTVVQDGRAVARVPAVLRVDGKDVNMEDPMVGATQDLLSGWLHAAVEWTRENSSGL